MPQLCRCSQPLLPYSCRLSGEGVAAATVGAFEATSCALDTMCGGADKGRCTMGACAREVGHTSSVRGVFTS